MKKYNRFDSHMVLLGMIIPFLVFFISMNATFAYFTATASETNSASQTAKINLSLDASGGNPFTATTESGTAKIMPGDTLRITGDLTNAGTADAYAILEFIVRLTKSGSQTTNTLKKEYYTFVGTTLTKITGSVDNYLPSAEIIPANTAKSFTSSNALTCEFPGATYDNSYKNAVVSYTVNAYGIQTSALPNDEVTATNILMKNAGYNSTKIYGNTIQDGTPSVASPVEIQSVGDRTKNLFNTNITSTGDAGASTNTTVRTLKEDVWYLGLTWNNYNNPSRLLSYSLNTDSISLESSGGYGISRAFKCKPNTQYSISYLRDTNAYNGLARYGLYKSNGEFIQYLSSPNITTPADCGILTVCFQSEQGVTTFSNIQLEENSVATSFEPYGYKIPVNINSKNLLNISGRSLGTLETGGNANVRDFECDKYYVGITANNYYYSHHVSEYSISENSVTLSATNGGYGVGFPIHVKPNTTYIISGDANDEIGVGYYTSAGQNLSWSTLKPSYPKTFTTPANCETAVIILRPAINTLTTYSNIQVEEGSTATTFQPGGGLFNIYLDEPLRKIGDVADVLDIETGEVVRHTRGLSFKVSNMNNNYDEYPGWTPCSEIVKDFPSENKKLGNLTSGYCNIGPLTQIGINAKASGVLWLEKSNFGLTQTQWITQYPDLVVEICYALPSGKSYTEKVEVPGIDFDKGYTITAINTTIAPSN